MAAIIAKITRENRERIKRRKNTIPIKKSRYSLPAFKDEFDPERDIKVFKNKNYHLLKVRLGNNWAYRDSVGCD